MGKNELSDFEKIGSLIASQNYAEAINELEMYVQDGKYLLEAIALLEYIHRILDYSHRDIYASTNLDLDPWEE